MDEKSKKRMLAGYKQKHLARSDEQMVQIEFFRLKIRVLTRMGLQIPTKGDANIRQWLTDDSAAFSVFQEMLDTVRSLDIKEREPSETSINILLEFSKLSAHEESHA